MDQQLKPKPEALKKIKHIIVLMLENHSFDHMLGWLYSGEHYPPPRGQEFEGLHRSMWNPLHSYDVDGVPVIEKVYVAQNGAPIRSTKFIKGDPHPPPDYCLPHPDPGEGFRDTNYQLFQAYQVPQDYPPEPTNMGFVDNYANTIINGTYRIFGGEINDPRSIMTCFTPEQLPVLSTLAREYAVCDHWFCSIPSQTLPNRAFIHAATSCGQVNNHPAPKCDARTIYNQIQDACDSGNSELAWRVYASTPKKFSQDQEADALTLDKYYFSLTRLMMTQLHSSAFDENFRSMNQFFEDAACGDLPSYAFLEPQYKGPGQNDQHPPSDVRAGEKLIADVYRAVVNSPQWHETLLVITYDEHGGCFDHVPPPKATPPDKNASPGQDGFTFNRFGIRVPAVLISPYIERGTIARPDGYTPFDHTSVIKTVQNCFDLGENLTGRDRDAPDLSCVLTLDEPRHDKPEVYYHPLESEDVEYHPNDLLAISADVLAELTGRERPHEMSVHDYLFVQFTQHFGPLA